MASPEESNSPQEKSKIRYAAKGLLVDSHDRLLMLRGKKTKRWSIAGGGQEPEEQLTDGFYRELHEETGLLPDDIVDLTPSGITEGEIDNNETAYWYVYKGRIVDNHTPIVPGDDIDAIEFMTIKEALALKGPTSELAQRAIRGMDF